jgi:hypothetical protein
MGRREPIVLKSVEMMRKWIHGPQEGSGAQRPEMAPSWRDQYRAFVPVGEAVGEAGAGGARPAMGVAVSL